MAVTAKTPAAVARELHGFLQDAMADIAASILEYPDGDDMWAARIARARKSGVRDLSGWLADELYNDRDTLADLLGDRISDEARGDETRFREIATELARTGHGALKRAVDDVLLRNPER